MYPYERTREKQNTTQVTRKQCTLENKMHFTGILFFESAKLLALHLCKFKFFFLGALLKVEMSGM